ncbi:hypothetical protein [Methylobacterium fujisawaense]
MSATVYGKWYWSDWMSDPGVRASSYAARGLWIDLLCIAATADPTGYVVLNGRPLTAPEIARLTGGHASEVEILLDELERNGVFTRDRHGRIYSRRMIRDKKKSALAVKKGKLGGNPTLRKQKENSAGLNLEDKGQDNTQKPEARSQKPVSSDARDVSVRCRQDVAAAFGELAPNRLVPDTNRVAVWLAAGHDPAVILAVIREGLSRKPDVGSLSYFDRRIEEASSGNRGAVARAAAKPATPEQDRRSRLAKAVAHFRGEWRQGWPDELRPGHAGCTTAPDIVEEARRTVSAERGDMEAA